MKTGTVKLVSTYEFHAVNEFGAILMLGVTPSIALFFAISSGVTENILITILITLACFFILWSLLNEDYSVTIDDREMIFYKRSFTRKYKPVLNIDLGQVAKILITRTKAAKGSRTGISFTFIDHNHYKTTKWSQVDLEFDNKEQFENIIIQRGIELVYQ